MPGKALISELQPIIEQLNEDAKIFEGEHIDKSGFMYPSMVETSPEIMEKVINRLQAFMDELKQEATPPPQSAQPQEIRKELHPIIKRLLDEELLEATPNPNGKYKKKGNKKDTEIVRWIVNYSGYEDIFTSSFYMEYVETNTLEKSIQDYIGRAKGESK